MDLDPPKSDCHGCRHLGLPSWVHNVACRPEFSAISVSAILSLSPSPAAVETRAEPPPGCLCWGFVSPLGDSRVCFLSPRPLHKAGVTALSREHSHLTHVCLKAGGLYGKRRMSLGSSAPARSPALSFLRRDGPRPHSVLSCDQDIVLLFETEFQSVDQASLIFSFLCLQGAAVKSKGHNTCQGEDCH